MMAMAVVWAVPCGAIWGVIPVISSMFFGPVGTLLVCLLILCYMVQSISKPEALAFLFACTFNVPCVMALSTTYRESHSLKWTARVALFYIGAALILACIVYHIAALFL